MTNTKHAFVVRELQHAELADKCIAFLDSIAKTPHPYDGIGFSYSGDTRDRHYIRVWEALHTKDTERLAAMCMDFDYASLMPFVLGKMRGV